MDNTGQFQFAVPQRHSEDQDQDRATLAVPMVSRTVKLHVSEARPPPSPLTTARGYVGARRHCEGLTLGLGKNIKRRGIKAFRLKRGSISMKPLAIAIVFLTISSFFPVAVLIQSS